MSFEFIDAGAALPVAPVSPDMLQLAASSSSEPLLADAVKLQALGPDADAALLSSEDEDLIWLDPGVQSGTTEDDPDPIVVVGRKLTDESDKSSDTGNNTGFYYQSENYTFSYGEPPLEGESPTAVPAPADEDVVEIKVNLANPTAEQVKIVADFKAAVEEYGRTIRAMDDNAKLTLVRDGKVVGTVTGAELKALWLKVDFVINPENFDYGNGNLRGTANFNGGDPIISFNMNLVAGYHAHGTDGLRFVIGHDFGHLTKVARDFYGDLLKDGLTEAERIQREQMANDISRAIANSAKLSVISNPLDGGYSTSDPLKFEVQTDGGGGGGGGWGGDYEPPV